MVLDRLGDDDEPVFLAGHDPVEAADAAEPLEQREDRDEEHQADELQQPTPLMVHLVI